MHDGLGTWLRDWRHENRWTQERLAYALGYDVSYVAKIERGARPPSRQLIARLADVVAVPRDELVQLVRYSSKLCLPALGEPLFGRQADLAEVSALIRGPARCVTLVGAPGIGKTSLALEVAWDVGHEFRHGAVFVALADVATRDAVMPALARSLRLADRGSRPPEELVVDALKSRATLVVLDNFEHLLEGRDLVALLIEQAPMTRLLITSREALNLKAEVEFRVRPLAVPGPALAGSKEAAAYPSVQMFKERSLRVRPDFALTESNIGAVTEICARLDGLPLGIRLAAAASQFLSPADIANSLRDRLELPAVVRPDPLAHPRLVGALDWSWDLLEPPDQALLARLAVFVGPFRLAAVEAVAAGDGVVRDPLAGLATLEAKHLVEVSLTARGDSLFRLLEPVRRYALDRLAERGEVDWCLRRHSSYYLERARAEEANLKGGPEQADSLRALEDDYPNLTAAHAWALTNEPETTLELSASLWRFFLIRRTSEGKRLVDAALARSPQPSLARVKALNGAAFLARTQGYLDEAEALIDTLSAAAAALPEGDAALARELALAALNRGIVAQERGAYDVAEASFREALARYERVRDERGVGHATNCLGVIALRRNDLDAASSFFFEALKVFRAVGDRWSIAVTATNLGWIAEVGGELDEAKVWYEETRQLWDSVGDELGSARALADLGRIARRRCDPRAARPQLEAALSALCRLGERRLAAACLLELAAVAAQRRRPELAARLIGAAEGQRQAIGVPPWPDERSLEDSLSETLVRSLGSGAVERARSMGKGLSLEDALALVEAGRWPPPVVTRTPLVTGVATRRRVEVG